MPGEHKYDFFIAHRGEDTAQAIDLYELLAPTHRTFLDKKEPPGTHWYTEIPEAQRASRITVVLVMDQQKHYQNEEIILGVALANDPNTGHRIVPVYLTGNGRPPRPPYGLAGFNPIMSEDEGGMEGVARALKRLVDIPQEHDAETASAPTGVLFDQSHGQQDWNPVNPTLNRDFSRIASLAKSATGTLETARITPALLSRLQAFVLPIGPGAGKHRPLYPSEEQALIQFGKEGGGLLLMSSYTGDWHHLWNLNDVARSFGMSFSVDAVTDSTLGRAGYGEVNANYPDDRGAFVAVPAPAPHDRVQSRLLDGVASVAVTACCTLRASAAIATSILVSDASAKRWEPEPTGIGAQIRHYYAAESPGQANVLMAASLQHRVIAVGSWKLFTNAFIESEFDNRRLLENILAWLTES